MEPKIGERIYDGACGSAGFLCEAFAYLIKLCKTAKDRETLQKKMLFGKENAALLADAIRALDVKAGVVV